MQAPTSLRTKAECVADKGYHSSRTVFVEVHLNDSSLEDLGSRKFAQADRLVSRVRTVMSCGLRRRRI